MSSEKGILVIDDEAAVRRSFELAVEDSGYTVIMVDRGERGIKDSCCLLICEKIWLITWTSSMHAMILTEPWQ
jgi:CheY-like chemotaxis protein